MQNGGTIGVDYAGLNLMKPLPLLRMPAFGSNRLGFISDNHAQNRVFTAKVVSNSSWNPNSWLNLKTSVGGDYVNTETENTNATGATLPPGAQRVQDAATITATDQQPTAVKTLGVYVQEQAGMRDRLFVTAAVRSDQNSAFGANFQRVFYRRRARRGFFPMKAFSRN